MDEPETDKQPPPPKPKFFLSAVTQEFGSLRRKVDEVVRFLGGETESMEIWGTESGDLRDILREKIDSCDEIIQIVGVGYGAEPPTVDSEYGRVSYTQYEVLYAIQQGKKPYLLFAGNECRRDCPVEKLDIPPQEYPDPEEYQEERRDLQAAYRAQLREGGH
ncbi:MAG: DUF4062 domain-containing protein, partial [Verrucomicrobiota bacterium]